MIRSPSLLYLTLLLFTSSSVRAVDPDPHLKTKICAGNESDCADVNSGKLEVNASFSAPPRTSPSYPGDKIRFVDMNVASGGVARGTAITSTVTYTTIFDYSGSGNLFSFLVTFEGNLLGADPFNVKVEIDGVNVIEITTADIGTNTIYNLSNNQDENTMGMSIFENVFRFASPRGGGLYYASSLKIAIKKASGGSKLFRAGAVYMTKET
jgi:hypothetical protein